MAYFDIANFNLTSFADAMPDLIDSTPKMVEVLQKDANGNLVTKNIANRGMFKKQIWDDVGGALGQFNKTVYVDQTNGDDNNTGAENNPFKTIKKACNSIPIGAYGIIVIKGDYNTDSLNENIVLINKNITIFPQGNLNITYYKNNTGYQISNLVFGLRNSFLSFRVLEKDNGKITFQSYTDTDSKVSPIASYLVVTLQGYCGVSLHGYTINDNSCIFEMNEGSKFISTHRWEVIPAVSIAALIFLVSQLFLH